MSSPRRIRADLVRVWAGPQLVRADTILGALHEPSARVINARAPGHGSHEKELTEP